MTTVCLAVKATPEAMERIEERKKIEGVTQLTPIQTVQATWPCYILPASTGVLSVACLVGANAEYKRRHAAVVAAASLTEAALSDYKAKVIEMVGENKEKQIREAVDQERINRDPPKHSEVILTDRGQTLCYDSICGRYFRCDIEVIRRAEIYMNRRLYSEMYMSLNEFYDEIGLPNCDVGDYMGWNVDWGAVEIYRSSKLTPDDIPCLVISFNIMPKYDFNRSF